MGNFRREDRGGFGGGSRGGFGGGRGGGRSFGGGRDGGFERRRPLEMHEVTCSKCGKQCEVPFKPTGDKPVYCSDCFKTEGGESRGRGNSGSSSGISAEQFNQLNTKLDKILAFLKTVEIEDDSDEEDLEDDDEDLIYSKINPANEEDNILLVGGI
jgi:CxxC-x17-CxxC domain-containing protein